MPNFTAGPYSANTTIWALWNTALTTALTTPQYFVTTGSTTLVPGGYTQELDEIRLLRERREAEWQAERERRYHEALERRQRADALAEEVLRSCLTADQRRDLAEDGAFRVTGSSGRQWLIRAYGQSGNVVLLNEDGSERARFCAHPPDVPDADAWLAQKLAIETDEEAFLDIANCHTQHGWRPPPVAANAA